MANACPLSNLHCKHCQSKGLPCRGHVDQTCFDLHPERRSGHYNNSVPRYPARSADFASPGSSGVAHNRDEPVIAAMVTKIVADAFSQMRLQQSELAFVGCALAADNRSAAAIAARPTRERQLPIRFREPSPSADHNRQGRPEASRLPLGHHTTAEPDATAVEPPISHKEEVLTLLDTAQLSLERARRRVVVMDSLPPPPPSQPAANDTNVSLLAAANAAMHQYFEEDTS